MLYVIDVPTVVLYLVGVPEFLPFAWLCPKTIVIFRKTEKVHRKSSGHALGDSHTSASHARLPSVVSRASHETAATDRKHRKLYLQRQRSTFPFGLMDYLGALSPSRRGFEPDWRHKKNYAHPPIPRDQIEMSTIFPVSFPSTTKAKNILLKLPQNPQPKPRQPPTIYNCVKSMSARTCTQASGCHL